MDPKDEKKVETPPQAPAEGAPKAGETPKVNEVKTGPTGLDALTPVALKSLYDRSPQMFKDAGIVKEEVPPKKEEPPAKKEETPAPDKAASAAPKLKYGDAEISLPTDVQVNLEVVNAHLANALENGLTAKQVQGQIDFQTKLAREEAKRRPAPEKVPTPEEIDAANVERLKADKEFGGAFNDNMEIARRAAVKFGDKEVLGKLATSDPVLVKHFWKIGLADAEDKTPRAPNRNGIEGTEAEEEQESYLKRRYNHPTSQTMFK